MQPRDLADPPGVRGLDLWRTVTRLRSDPLAFLLDLRRNHGDVARVALAHRSFVLVSHPDGIRHVLVDNARAYGKNTATFAKVRSVLGDGLLTSDGDDWLRRRRIAQPAFAHEHTRTLAPLVVRSTSAMIARWRRHAGAPIDLANEMTRLTVEIVGRALLGVDLDDEAEGIGRAMGTLVRGANRRIRSLFDLGGVLPTRENASARRALDSVVGRLVAGPPDGPSSLVCRLRAACKSDEGSIDAARLRDELTTFLVAGHETTANVLVWSLHEVAHRPEVLKRIRRGCEETPYLENVIKESMRLHPPAWLLERRALVDDAIAGYRIPRGTTVAISPYVTHRHPDLWADPDAFDPERFARVQRFAFLPFGAGARQCIGGHFAMMEAKIVLEMILGAFALEPLGPPEVPCDAGVTLRPRDPVLVSAREMPPAGGS